MRRGNILGQLRKTLEPGRPISGNRSDEDEDNLPQQQHRATHELPKADDQTDSVGEQPQDSTPVQTLGSIISARGRGSLASRGASAISRGGPAGRGGRGAARVLQQLAQNTTTSSGFGSGASDIYTQSTIDNDSYQEQRAPVVPRSIMEQRVAAMDNVIEERETSSRSETTPSRRGSTGSSTSSMSQHFAVVKEPIVTLLAKQPSTQGAPIQLSTNYMTFDVKDRTSIEEYHVQFEPSIESIRMTYALLKTEPAMAVVGRVMHWTGTNMYLPIRLPDKVTKFQVTHPATQQPINVTLTHVKCPPDEELMSFYNSLMHKVMLKLRYVIFNRKHFSPDLKIRVPEFRLEVWPGWVTAVQRLDGGLKLVIDSSFKVIRQDTVLDMMRQIHRNLNGQSLKEALEANLIGSIVMTTYNNRAYRIDGVEIGKKPTDTFVQDRTNSEQISYIDYMRQHWNVQITDQRQPLLIHHPKPKLGRTGPETIYLVPELCVATGLTDDMRQNYNVMKAVGDHTRLPPDTREIKLKEFLVQISSDERARSILDDWNLSVRPQLDVISGRRLENETILFGNDRTARVPDNADWTRPATGGSVFKSVDIENWVLMHTDRDAPVANDLLANIRDISRTLGIKFCKPRIIVLPNDSSTTYVNSSRKEIEAKDQMVVLITPGKGQREDRYSAVKRVFSCEKGIPCQFIRAGTINNPKKIRSVCQKVVIQILSKVGGQPWAIRFPMKSFMIIGIDTYHDTIDRKKSCVGFVASMNEYASSWWSHIFYQDSLQEIGQKLTSCLGRAVGRFHQLNGFLPQKIIVYRDGVGDGQLKAVIDFEISQMTSGLNFYISSEHPSEASPVLSYIIVQKRINTKLSLRSMGKVSNPLPGSYLDHTITNPQYNDFYLVSQHVNQGTVSPTKYILISEQGNLKLDHHQKLAYKMTHMYYNWCGTVRVPAPCQYAHKLAYLNGENIRAPVLESIEDKLYYL